jgi:hypothetical protein
VSRFRPVSYRLCSGTSGFGLETFGLGSGNSWVVSDSSRSTCSRESSCISYISVVWGGLVVSGGRDRGCGGDGWCSMMMVNGRVSDSGSS